MAALAKMHQTRRTGSSRPGPSGRRRRSPWYVTVFRVLAVSAAAVGLVVFCYYAARVTLTPVADNGQAGGNTDPGWSFRFYYNKPVSEALQQLGGNLLLLAPLGVLLPVVSTRLRGPVRLTLLGCLISLAIESAQGLLVTGRAFDIDDVILNTSGVLLAYLLIGRRVSYLVRGKA